MALPDGPRPLHTLTYGPCTAPECTGTLVLRRSRLAPTLRRFLGCSAYPRCGYTRSIDEADASRFDPPAPPAMSDERINYGGWTDGGDRLRDASAAPADR